MQSYNCYGGSHWTVTEKRERKKEREKAGERKNIMNNRKGEREGQSKIQRNNLSAG